MAWDPAFQPDTVAAAPPAAPAWDPAFQPDNPHSTGQGAAQAAGVKPVAKPAPMLTIGNARNANLGIAPSAAPAAPAGASSDEPTFGGSPATMSAFAGANRGGPDTGSKMLAAQAKDAAANEARLRAVEAAAGGPFNPASGDNSVWQRARMGIMATPQDRAKYLQDNLPPGSEVKVINAPGVGPMVVFRRPGDDAYHPIRGTGDTMGGIGDLLSGVPAVATQAAIAATPVGDVAQGAKMLSFLPGRSLIARLFAQGLGGAAERGAELAANASQGYDQQPLSADAKSMAQSAAAADVGELGGSLLSYGNRLKKGTAPGFFNIDEIGQARLAAEKELSKEFPDLTPLDITNINNRKLEKKGALLSSLDSKLRNQTQARNTDIGNMVAEYMKRATGGTAPAIGDEVKDVVAGMRNEAAAPLAHVPDTSLTQGGRAIGDIYRNAIPQAVQRTNDKYGAVIDRMNNAPDQPNGVRPIDLSATHGVIDKESTPIYGQGVPEKGTDEAGAPFVRATKVQTEGGISPQIQSVVDRLRSLNPQLGVGPMTADTSSPYTSLRGIYSRLGEASVYNPLDSNADKFTVDQAKRIFVPLQESIDEAVGPLAKAARASKRFQTDILDNPDAIAARETTTPEANMKYASPGNSTFLKNTDRLAKATGQSNVMDIFRNALLSSAKRDPAKAERILAGKAEDPAAFSRAVPPENEAALSKFSEGQKRVDASLPNQLAQTPDYSARAVMAMQRGDTAGLNELVTRGGGKDSAIGQNVRGAMFKNIISNSMDQYGHVRPKALAGEIGKLLSDGRAEAVLHPDEVKFLGNLQKFAEGAGSGAGSDFAASVAGTGAVKESTDITASFHPKRLLGVLGDLFVNRFQNHTWLSQAGRDFLTREGEGAEYLPRALGTGGAEMYLDQKRQDKQVTPAKGR